MTWAERSLVLALFGPFFLLIFVGPLVSGLQREHRVKQHPERFCWYSNHCRCEHECQLPRMKG